MGLPFYKLMFGSLFLLITHYHHKEKAHDFEKFLEDHSHTNGLPHVEEFDFIVVGGGTSGLVVAEKLSRKHKVLIIEAGGDPLPQQEVPANVLFLHAAKEISYQWTSVPQNYSGLKNKGVEIPKNSERVSVGHGKSIGGTSSINAMIYNRGSPKDYNNWAELTGDSSWSYENLQKYFFMNENHQNVKGLDKETLGYSGRLILSEGLNSFDNVGNQWQKAWAEAGIDLGFGTFDEPNGPQIEGFGPFMETKLFGKRFSTFEGFLKPFLDRSTLTIHRYSEATQIEIDENNSTIGVFYKRHGINQYAKVKKEVIISCGTLNTPKLLMLSGIGEDLEEAGIRTRVKLPVGKRYQDHPIVFQTGIKAEKWPYQNIDDQVFSDFIDNGKGPLSTYFSHFGQAYIVSSVGKADPKTKNWPDIQLFALFNSSQLYNGNDNIIILTSLGLPSSYGSLSLNITHPESPLIWDPNFLNTDRDVEILLEGLKIASKVFDTKAFKDLGFVVSKKPEEKCKAHKYESDQYFYCLMKTILTGHPVGSCPMGKGDDEWAVVDSKLKVKNVSGLRIIDNSIQPMIVNTNTMSSALLIGQKGADMILKEWERNEEF